jgi:hypothetical protein
MTSIIIYLFEFQLPMCSVSPKFLNFKKRDCGTIPVAEIICMFLILHFYYFYYFATACS